MFNDCRGMQPKEIKNIILRQRNVDHVDDFLNPDVKHLLPLNSLENIKKAKDIVIKGIDQYRAFKILYDVDLDGISAGTIIERYLRNFTSNIQGYINEGKSHGLMYQDLNNYQDGDILIVVDSLDSDVSAYKWLFQKGIKIIVLDHHDIDYSEPYSEYTTLVSSQQNYDNPALSGSGVVWKFCKYLDTFFNTNYADNLIDLAACGIVGDMCDLSENSMENRYIVSQGLKTLCNPAIKKIVGSFPFNSTAISFSIAPLINAANRTKNNELAKKAFLTDDNKELNQYIKDLKKCKIIQNEEVAYLMPEILSQAQSQLNKNIISVFINSENNIAGLIANKLISIYQRPIFVLSQREIDGYLNYAGSARAIGIDNFSRICNDTNLCKAKGHESAFGIEVKESDFNSFIDEIQSKLYGIEFVVNENIDIQLNLEDITRDLIDEIKQIDFISGEGFKPVKVQLSNIQNYYITDMSDRKHLVINPTDYLQLIKWNWDGDWDYIEDCSLLNEPISVIGQLDYGWIGRRFALKIICNTIKVGDDDI